MLTRIILATFLLLAVSFQSFGQSRDKLEELKKDLEYLIETKNWKKANEIIQRFYYNYPENPTELQIVEKYEVDRINRTVQSAIEEEERLYRRLKNESSPSLAETYLTKYPYGQYRNEVRELLSYYGEEASWQSAKSRSSSAAYYEYLDKYPRGKYAEEARSQVAAWDKAAYENAIEKGTASALEYYLDRYPKGKYRNEIRERLEEREEYEAYMYAKNNNRIENYETYIRRYPNGKYATEVNRIIENSYFKFGNDAYAAKNHHEAIKYFETYLSKFPNGAHASEARDKISKSRRKLSQSDTDFFIYTYEQESPLGFSFGSLNTRSSGYYINIKMDSDILKGLDALWVIDNQGNSDSPWDLEHTGETVNANFAISGGLTFKIAYPFWAYLGGGIGYYTIYEQIDEYDASGELYETVWMRNTDQTSWEFFPEGGLKLKVANALVLKYGLMYKGGFNHQFGLGFQL